MTTHTEGPAHGASPDGEWSSDINRYTHSNARRVDAWRAEIKANYEGHETLAASVVLDEALAVELLAQEQ